MQYKSASSPLLTIAGAALLLPFALRFAQTQRPSTSDGALTGFGNAD
jgi:hypothetical protein